MMKTKQTVELTPTADSSPNGILLCGSFKSPLILTPARTPKKLAKKTPNTVKKDCSGMVWGIPTEEQLTAS